MAALTAGAPASYVWALGIVVYFFARYPALFEEKS
jgi:hypothetical protein